MAWVGAAPALAAPGAVAAPARPAAASSSLHNDRIEELERNGSMRPQEAAAGLRQMVGASPAGSSARLAALTALGQVLADARAQAEAEQVLAELQAWPVAAAPNAAASDALPDAQIAARLLGAMLQQQARQSASVDRLLDEAWHGLTPSSDPLLRLRVLTARAFRQSSVGRIDESLASFDEAVTLARRLGRPLRTALLLNQLAYTYAQAGQSERARQLSAEAFAAAGADADTATLSELHNVRAIIATRADQFDIARSETQLSLDYAMQSGNKRVQARRLANLADSDLHSRDFPAALEHAQRSLVLCRELDDATGETVGLANIGLAFIGMKRFAEGKKALLESIAIDEQHGQIPSIADTYQEMGEALERSGDLMSAVDALHRYRKLADEVWRRDQQQALLEQQARFDDARRARSIEALAHESQLQAAGLWRADLQQGVSWMLSVAGVLMVGLAVVGVRRLRRVHSALAETNDQLQWQSERDPLTGLFNRRRCQLLMQELAPQGVFRGSLLLIDVDHFKRINDDHGHAAGDAVLVEMGARLKAALREVDLAVRWGGEEFLIVTRARDPDRVARLAERLLAVVAQTPVQHGDDTIALTASIGFAALPLERGGPGLSWENAVKLVDAAMYLAKARGRHRAIGVRAMADTDAASVDAAIAALGSAWQAGSAELVEIGGVEATAAASA